MDLGLRYVLAYNTLILENLDPRKKRLKSNFRRQTSTSQNFESRNNFKTLLFSEFYFLNVHEKSIRYNRCQFCFPGISYLLEYITRSLWLSPLPWSRVDGAIDIKKETPIPLRRVPQFLLRRVEPTESRNSTPLRETTDCVTLINLYLTCTHIGWSKNNGKVGRYVAKKAIKNLNFKVEELTS